MSVLWCTAATATAAILDVCRECPLQSVTAGIARAGSGDTLRIHAGLYQEGTIVIDKPLQIVGIDGPVIDGRHAGHVFHVRADQVTLEGLTIQNGGMSDIADLAGVRVERSRGCAIRRNRFYHNTYSVYLARVTGCDVRDNIIQSEARGEVSGGNGIHLWHAQEIDIAGNSITGHRDGLYFEFAERCRIEKNSVHDNIRYGLHFMFSHENHYADNVFSRNQTGVAVMYSRHIRMVRNQFAESWGRASYGLLLKDIVDSHIAENDFIGNTIGIYADGSNRNTFRHNRFHYNGWAVHLLGSSDANTFVENDFHSNYFSVTTNTRHPLNTFARNYWDEYQGYDLDRDGWGDVPFRPMKLFNLWLNRYPELIVLFGSPVIEFLEVAERVFPVLTPRMLQDTIPSMHPLVAVAQ